MRTTIRNIALSLTLVCTPNLTTAQIFTGETYFERLYGRWHSFMLVLPNTVSMRATTIADDGTLPFVVDFYPPKCQPNFSFMVPLNYVADKDVTRNDVIVSFRADTGARIDSYAVSMITMGDTSGIIAPISSDITYNLVSEMKRGYTLRVKVSFGPNSYGNEDLYFTYPLSGFTASYIRAEDMCMNPTKYRGSK